MAVQKENRTIVSANETDPDDCTGCPEHHEAYDALLNDGKHMPLATRCDDASGFTTTNRGRILTGGPELNPQNCVGCNDMHYAFLGNRSDGTSVELQSYCGAGGHL